MNPFADTSVVSIQLSHVACYKCGVTFAMPQSFIEKRKNDKQEWFCPNGHGQIFSKGEVDRLKTELETEKRLHGYTKNSLEFSRKAEEHATRQRNALKGVVTKIKTRVGNGVCPCCNRTFQNLQNHMHKQHPEFKVSE